MSYLKIVTKLIVQWKYSTYHKNELQETQRVVVDMSNGIKYNFGKKYLNNYYPNY